ncbi:MAG: hypothetical protein AAGH15_08565 [Myxococcota bacterium]
MPANPYDDGLSIALELSAPATRDDRERAYRLLDRWLARYEGEPPFEDQPPRYRNCGVEGDVGSPALTLWADRIVDPEGDDAALRWAEAIAEEAATHPAVRAARVGDATDPSNNDTIARLGTSVLEVRPGGNLVDAWERQAYGGWSERVKAGRLRPGGWALAVAGALAVVRRLADAPFDAWLVLSGLLVAFAAIASRRRLGRPLQTGAALAVTLAFAAPGLAVYEVYVVAVLVKLGWLLAYLRAR